MYTYYEGTFSHHDGPLLAPDITFDDGVEILHSINAVGAQRNLKRTQ